jgi:predicted metal-dependent hydrolase
MAPKDCSGPLHPAARHGLELFNAGEYFEAHEALEAAWRAETGPIRELYRGILQVAVVYLHVQRRNFAGATKVYARCQRWLAPWPDTCRGVDVGGLRRSLHTVMEAVTRLGPGGIRDFDVSLFKPVKYE